MEKWETKEILVYPRCVWLGEWKSGKVEGKKTSLFDWEENEKIENVVCINLLAYLS